jgi:hypothetical protein
LFIHDTNFARQVLAAMAIIIRFLPHHIAAGDRERGGEEGCACDRNRLTMWRSPEQIKPRDAKAMLGFVIDSLD